MNDKPICLCGHTSQNPVPKKGQPIPHSHSHKLNCIDNQCICKCYITHNRDIILEKYIRHNLYNAIVSTF